jgi:hypothetical protein
LKWRLFFRDHGEVPVADKKKPVDNFEALRILLSTKVVPIEKLPLQTRKNICFAVRSRFGEGSLNEMIIGVKQKVLRRNFTK